MAKHTVPAAPTFVQVRAFFWPKFGPHPLRSSGPFHRPRWSIPKVELPRPPETYPKDATIGDVTGRGRGAMGGNSSRGSLANPLARARPQPAAHLQFKTRRAQRCGPKGPETFGAARLSDGPRRRTSRRGGSPLGRGAPELGRRRRLGRLGDLADDQRVGDTARRPLFHGLLPGS